MRTMQCVPQDMRRLSHQAEDVTKLFQMLGIVSQGAQSTFTTVGRQMMWLPEVGGVRWRCILAKGAEAGIGIAVLKLCAGMMSLPNDKDGVLGSVPAFCIDGQLPGDVSSLYRLFDAAYKEIARDEADRPRKKGSAHLKEFVRRSFGGNDRMSESFKSSDESTRDSGRKSDARSMVPTPAAMSRTFSGWSFHPESRQV